VPGRSSPSATPAPRGGPRSPTPSAGSPAKQALVPPDEELVKRASAGEKDAFEPLVRRYADNIVRFVHHMIGDFQAAEDIAQEAFLKAYAHLGRLEQPERFSTWLYSIARHSCLDWIRAKRSGPSVEDLHAMGVEPADVAEDTPERPSEVMEAHTRVVDELQALREDYRDIILLKHVHELSYKEIGEIVGLSPSAVGEKLSRVRQMLRNKLSRRPKKR
jgi:RNA polymerase sigma-70 factor (ECF subfamily)